jgi:hypothetical protein
MITSSPGLAARKQTTPLQAKTNRADKSFFTFKRNLDICPPHRFKLRTPSRITFHISRFTVHNPP